MTTSTPTDEALGETVNDNETQHTTNPRPPWRSVRLSRIPRGTEQGSSDGYVGGVVAGLSRAYGFDLRSTRIAMVVATLIVPVLFVAYIAAWVLLPHPPEQPQSISSIVRDRRRLPVLLTIGLVLVVGSLGSFGTWFLFRGAPWGLVLIAVGVLLWVSTSMNNRDSESDDLPSPGTPVGEAMPLVASATGDSASDALPDPTAVVPTLATAKLRRRRRPIGLLSIVAAAAFVGVAAILNAAGAWNPLMVWVVVAALGAVMVGLTVSAFVNRHWWIGLPVVAIGFVVMVLSIAQPHLEGGTGDRSLKPTTIATAQQFEQLGIGQLEIDLRSLPEGTETVAIRARVGVGRLHVIVPANVMLQLDTLMGAGDVMVNDREVANGMRHRDSRVIEPTSGPAIRTVVLDLTMGIGSIDVEQVG